MLGVGLRKLCPLDSFGYAFREKKTVRTSTPGGCKTGPQGVQNGLREASGRLFCASWLQLGHQGRSEAVVGRPWGRSWDACDALGAVLGASWGVPGRSRPSLEGHFGTPQGLIWTIWALSVAQREIQQNIVFYGVFGLPGPPGRLRNRSKIGPGSLLDVYRSGGPKVRYMRPKLAPRVALGPAGTRRASRKPCSPKSKSR